MAQFKGDSRDAKRARQGARVQEEMKEAFERKIQQMRQETEVAVQNMELNQMFSYEDNTADKKFKESIIGLQSHDEYKNKLDTYLEHSNNLTHDMDEEEYSGMDHGIDHNHYTGGIIHNHNISNSTNNITPITTTSISTSSSSNTTGFMNGSNSSGSGINASHAGFSSSSSSSSSNSTGLFSAGVGGMASSGGSGGGDMHHNQHVGDNQEYTNSSTSQRLKMLEKQLLYKKNKGKKRKLSDITLSFDFDEDIAPATSTNTNTTIPVTNTTTIPATTTTTTTATVPAVVSNGNNTATTTTTTNPINGNTVGVATTTPSTTTTNNTTNTTDSTDTTDTTDTNNTNTTATTIPSTTITTTTDITNNNTAVATINGDITDPVSKRRKLSKNPHVDTSFLPDPERDAADARLRMELEKEWNERQKQVKRERLEITYSYWDGSGHRRSIEIVKGMKVGEFLELCRKELSQHFSELRGISGEHLMYIKDDLIIPHSYAFYDLILAGGRGKSGNYMFKNESYDKGDYRIERDGGHPGKIITRAWYDRNKHIFPASRWEVYDPTTQEENR